MIDSCCSSLSIRLEEKHKEKEPPHENEEGCHPLENLTMTSEMFEEASTFYNQNRIFEQKCFV